MADKCSECDSEVGEFGVEKIVNCETTGMNYCEDCHEANCDNEECLG